MCFFKETNTPHSYILQCSRIYSNFERLKEQSFFHLQLGASIGKGDQKSVRVYQNHNCFGQRPKGSSKVLFKLG